jgi:hypothetical protein
MYARQQPHTHIHTFYTATIMAPRLQTLSNDALRMKLRKKNMTTSGTKKAMVKRLGGTWSSAGTKKTTKTKTKKKKKATKKKTTKKKKKKTKKTTTIRRGLLRFSNTNRPIISANAPHLHVGDVSGNYYIVRATASSGKRYNRWQKMRA